MHRFPSITVVLGLFWVLSIAFGLYWITQYEYTPGLAGNPHANWPKDTKLQLNSQKATLVMIAHPHCPCTRASIDELSKLIAQRKGKLSAYILFLSPTNMNKSWEKTDLWQTASQIPDVQVLSDIDGVEAKHFCAETSGQTMLYSSNGQLIFSGGITDGRGHIGDNSGIYKIMALLDQKILQPTSNLVFGCPLTNPR